MTDGFEWIWDLQNKAVAFPFQAGLEPLYQIDLRITSHLSHICTLEDINFRPAVPIKTSSMTHCAGIKYSSPCCVKGETCIELLQRRLVSVMYETAGMIIKEEGKKTETLCTMAGIGLKKCLGADPGCLSFLSDTVLSPKKGGQTIWSHVMCIYQQESLVGAWEIDS